MLNSPLSIKFLLLAITITVLWSAQLAYAGLFKWTDDTGKMHYTDDKGKIPLKYRTKTKIKKLRTLNERSSNQGGSSSAGESGAEETVGSGSIDKKGILSEQEGKTVNDTIEFFTSENERSAKYKGLANYSPTYRKMSLEIEKNLPQKKKLIAALSKPGVPAIKETYQFLKKSEAADELRLKTVWQDGYTGGYFGRILGEIEVKNDLIGKLNGALEESRKLKEAKENLEKEKAEKEKQGKNTK